jgi:putative isomerase
MADLTKRGLLTTLTGAALSTPLTTPAVARPMTSRPSHISGGRAALLDYFHGNAPKQLRDPGGELRFASISPSLPHSQYSAELWDWDTLWTARGLFRTAHLAGDDNLRQAVALHAKGSLDNFFDHQSDEGRIPMLITVSKPDPLGCLKGTRPHRENQAKPVLAQLALLTADEMGDASWFAPHFDALQRFYDSWTADNLTPPGLLVWGSDVAIGNDNDPTTFGRPFFSSANLLLNCLYYQDLAAAIELAKRLGKPADALTARRDALGQAIQAHCWDPRDRFFYTADVQCVDRRAELIPTVKRGMDMSWSTIPLRIQTFTGFLPLWCGLATTGQAASMAEHYRDPKTFNALGGVRSLSASETMYSLAASTNPSNWLGPVWIIVNYLVWKGLSNYGHAADAKALAGRTIDMLARDLKTSGTLNEYYHPETGAPLSHKGFMDWNLLALEMT